LAKESRLKSKGLAAREKVVREFDSKVVGEKYIELYEAVRRKT